MPYHLKKYLFMNENTIGMSGQMGQVISLFRLYRDTGEEEWKIRANKLLDTLWENCDGQPLLSYSHGLLGVGVGTEYLIQNGFADGNADEILEEIDSVATNIVHVHPVMDLTISNGLLGLACYFYYRLCYRLRSAEPRVLMLKEYTVYLVDWIADSLKDPALPRNYYEVYFILVMLHRLNLCNAKIEHLIHRCNQEISTLQS